MKNWSMGLSHADFEAVALETLQHEGILNPIQAKQILASQPMSDKKIFEALVIANPMYAKFRNQETVLLLEEMRFDIDEEDPVKNFVKLYEERDQKILSLLGGTKVTLAHNN